MTDEQNRDDRDETKGLACLLQEVCPDFHSQCATNWYYVEQCDKLIAYQKALVTRMEAEKEQARYIDSLGYHPVLALIPKKDFPEPEPGKVGFGARCEVDRRHM